MHRRQFITGLISLVAAPAIVRASSLMPVKSLYPPNHIFVDWAAEAGGDGSIARPFTTIQHAMNLVEGFDFRRRQSVTISVESGEYREWGVMTPPNANITIQGRPNFILTGEAPELVAAHLK